MIKQYCQEEYGESKESGILERENGITLKN